MPNATPVELEIRVKIVVRDGKPYFHYILRSAAGINGLGEREISGPKIEGSPDEYHAFLSEKVRKLGERMDVDDSPLLCDEIRRKLESFGQDLYRELFQGKCSRSTEESGAL